ncbi:MAG: ATP-binding protein [Oleiphilaceae bacterium]|nr:ATP-binding protein [Oleiphilaceae bacterium]
MDMLPSHFMGHGHCYLWRPDLLWLHIGSDTLITLAYFSIPVALWVLMKKRRDLEYRWMFVLFALFIFACGTTHLMNIWNVWHGNYYLSGHIKLVTGLVSVLTAVLVWPLIPRVLALPSPSALAAANNSLRREVDRREASEGRLEEAHRELKLKVEELTRTKEQLEQEALERKNLENQLREQNQAFARSNQELEQFAFVASHDLREPLRKLMSFTQLLGTGRYGQFDDKGNEFVGYIRDSAQRMESLLDSLLRFSRVSSQGLSLEPVALEKVAEEMKRDLQLSIEESNARIEVEPLPTVSGDRTQLRQLLQNLVSNAIKYRQAETPPVIRIHGEAAGPDHYDLHVSDNGIGFDMAYKDQIFEVFKRLHGKTDYSGTGMGLAICKKIAERHGGRIDVVSEPGEGTRFTVRLPVHQEEGTLEA